MKADIGMDADSGLVLAAANINDVAHGPALLNVQEELVLPDAGYLGMPPTSAGIFVAGFAGAAGACTVVSADSMSMADSRESPSVGPCSRIA